MGTPYDATKAFLKRYKEGVIWYFDNFELSPMALYRALFQLKQAGWLDTAKGFLFGRNFAPKEIAEFTQDKAISKALADLGVPIICEVDISHLLPQWTILNGSVATVSYQEGKATLLQQLV